MVEKLADKPTRFAADLVEAAAVEGPIESRSAKMQLEHWARVGMHVSMRETASRRRVEAVIAGEILITELVPAEQVVANAELDTLIDERAGRVSLGQAARQRGFRTATLDDQGRLVITHPDGTTTVVDEA
jgi:hypothetical protein